MPMQPVEKDEVWQAVDNDVRKIEKECSIEPVSEADDRSS